MGRRKPRRFVLAVGVLAALVAATSGCGDDARKGSGSSKPGGPCQSLSLRKCFLLGAKMQKDVSKKAGLKILDFLCQKGTKKTHLESCTIAGHIYAKGGKDVTKDEATARARYERACDLATDRMHQRDACFELGVAHGMKKLGVKADDQNKALEYFQEACKGGRDFGCKMAKIAEGKVKGGGKTYRIADLTKQCRAGEKMACVRAGFAYDGGKAGAAQDRKKALAYFTRACAQSSGVGCRQVGVYYTIGKGTAKDHKKNIGFLRKGCELDDGVACYWVALGHKNGKVGFDKNAKKARKMAAKGCKLGYARACALAKKI